jgi:integrase
VRYRHAGSNRSRTFDLQRDARDFDARVHRARQAGELHLLDVSDQPTVDEYSGVYWNRHVLRLTPATQATYAIALRRIVAELGPLRLREVRPAAVAVFQDRLRREGVGEPTILRTLVVAQGMFGMAILEDLVGANPVAPVRKPSQRRTRTAKPIPPAQVERMRAWLLTNPRRRTDADRQRDATLLGVLAYAGLRPESEALTLRWEHVRLRVLEIPAGRKRGARDRTVRLLAPLRADLAAWRVAQGAPRAGAVFGEWTGTAWDNWRRRVFDRAAKAAGLAPDARPRDLRGSFASLLIAEGQSVLEVARQLGHSPTMTLNTYAALFDDFDPAHRIDPEAEIARARTASVPSAAGVDSARRP